MLLVEGILVGVVLYDAWWYAGSGFARSTRVREAVPRVAVGVG